MEIRTDIQSLNSIGPLQQGVRQINNYAKINTNDVLVKSETPDASLQKPEVNVEKTVETQAVVEKPEVVSPLTAAIGATPGPSTAIISAQLQKLEKIGVQFLEKRLIPIPLLKHKKIGADTASSILTSGNKSKLSRLRAKSGSAVPVPVTDFNDIGELSALKGVGVLPSEGKELAGFLKYAGSLGLEFRTDDSKNVGEYGAYNLLTTGWGIAGQTPKPVELVREGVSIITLKPGENRSPEDLRKELDECWKAIDEINGYKEPKKYFQSLSKPFEDLSFLEKFQAYNQMDKYCDRALSNYEITTKYAKDKKEMQEIADLLNKQEILEIYKEQEFDPADVELMMKKPIPDDVSPKEKSEVIRGLRRQITYGNNSSFFKGRKQFIRDSFKLVQKSSKDGKDFLRLSKLYLNIVDALRIGGWKKESEFDDAFYFTKKAFNFITGQLKGNQNDAETFVGLLRGSSIDRAKKRFQFIQTPVKLEDMETRINVAHTLAETPGFEENFRMVLENVEPGKDPADLTALIMGIREIYKDDDAGSKKAFMDVINAIQMSGLTFIESIEAMDVFGSSLEKSVEGFKVLSVPVGGSSLGDRKNLLSKLRSNYKALDNKDISKNEGNDNNALEDYKLVSSTVLKGETLKQAGDRFQMIFDNLGGAKHIEEVRDMYTVVTESMKEGNSILSNELIQKVLLGGKNRDEIRKMLMEDIRDAANMSKNGEPQANRKIVQDKEKVIIGGVKLDKKKYDNLLRVLGQPENEQ